MTTLTQAQASDLFRAPPHRWVDVGNGEVAVRTTGTGPDVVLVHGWPVSGATWRTLLPHLVPHLRCHVLDLVGAGDSRFDRSVRLGVAEHADAVRRAVDALQLDDVAVLAHDSGGLVGRHALAGDPRVRAWGLVDTELSTGIGWRFRSFVAARHLPGIEHALAHLLNAPRLRRSSLLLGDAFDDPDLLDGDFNEFFLRPLRDDPERRWAAGELLRHLDLATIHDLPRVHRAITAPVQLVYGEHDRFFPAEDAARMVAGFGGPAALHVVPRARLFTHEEFPEETARALLPVLTDGRSA